MLLSYSANLRGRAMLVFKERKDVRELTLLTGSIIAVGNRRAFECAVLNISKSGACLLVPNARAVPDAFELRLDRETARYACKVVWRSNNRVGITRRLIKDGDREDSAARRADDAL